MTATFDRTISELLSALDVACDAAARPSADRTAGDDQLAELLASVRLEMTVARAGQRLDRADDSDEVAAALESVAESAGNWLDDTVVQRRLGRMRVRDRAAAVTCRVNAASAELRRTSSLLRSGGFGDFDGAHGAATRTMRSVRATLEDAVLSVRHAD